MDKKQLAIMYITLTSMIIFIFIDFFNFHYQQKNIIVGQTR